VWLRTPGARPGAIVERCAALGRRARAVGLPIVIGCDAAGILEATSCGVAGVVLRGDPDRAVLERARATLGDRAWLARSTHAIADDHALVDWTVLGPIFVPHTAKPHGAVPLGPEVLAQATRPAGARVVAIGGIDRHGAAACVAAGAWGLAGIRSFFGPPDEVVEDVAVLQALLQPAEHGQTSS
jgi:thiamine-phosphate pyrophosphorylase